MKIEERAEALREFIRGCGDTIEEEEEMRGHIDALLAGAQLLQHGTFIPAKPVMPISEIIEANPLTDPMPVKMAVLQDVLDAEIKRIGIDLSHGDDHIRAVDHFGEVLVEISNGHHLTRDYSGRVLGVLGRFKDGSAASVELVQYTVRESR
jgi:hypothetical protein